MTDAMQPKYIPDFIRCAAWQATVGMNAQRFIINICQYQQQKPRCKRQAFLAAIDMPDCDAKPILRQLSSYAFAVYIMSIVRQGYKVHVAAQSCLDL